MKVLITVFTIGQIFFVNSAFASISYIETSSYHCSNGKSYDLARSFNQEASASMSNWGLSAFCSSRTLNEHQYSFFFTAEEAHGDLQECMNDKSDETLTCFKEYRKLNKVEGQGKLPTVKSAQKSSPRKLEMQKAFLVNGAVE